MRNVSAGRLRPTEHVVRLPDGDAIVLHEDRPQSWRAGDRSMLLVHGLSGCHAAPYMLRLGERFVDRGLRVFRMDMRGCGAGATLSRNVTHAGRSEDLLAALDKIAELTEAGPLLVTGVSLGGNQLLRAAGRVCGGHDSTPAWFDRLERIAAVAPPVDLQRCSDNLQRWEMRPYNYYFIRALLARTPALVRDREDFQRGVQFGRPRTMRELDDRFTAPLSGFADAAEYYAKASAASVSRQNSVPTLVLAAKDDPIVPIGCFVDDSDQWSASTQLVVTRTGGHVGFIDRRKRSWMDDALDAWFV